MNGTMFFKDVGFGLVPHLSGTGGGGDGAGIDCTWRRERCWFLVLRAVEYDLARRVSCGKWSCSQMVSGSASWSARGLAGTWVSCGWVTGRGRGCGWGCGCSGRTGWPTAFWLSPVSSAVSSPSSSSPPPSWSGTGTIRCALATDLADGLAERVALLGSCLLGFFAPGALFLTASLAALALALAAAAVHFLSCCAPLFLAACARRFLSSDSEKSRLSSSVSFSTA